MDVTHLGGCGDDDRARRQYLLLTIFLSHRERILAGRDVDTEGASEVRCGFDSMIETCVLAGVAAGPHPVGAQGDAT